MTQIDRILGGAMELFLKAGIKSVTMDDIARQIGMSKKTIYQSFKDKDDLVTALVKKRLEQDTSEMYAAIDKGGNTIEQLIEMMKCSEEVLGRTNPVVIYDLQRYYPEAWKEFTGFKHNIMVNIFVKLLRRGKQEGFIRPEIDEHVLALMRVNQIEMGFNMSIFPQGEFSTWKVQSQFLDHFTYGVCTLKGHQELNKYKNISE